MIHEEPYYYGFIIEKTGKRMRHALQKAFANNSFDITVDQWVILYELHKKNKLNQNQLAQYTFKDPPTVTRIIDILCKKGFTDRVASEDDRRKFEIHLTTLGKAKVQTCLPVVKEIRTQGWKGLDKKDYTDLLQILDTIFNNLEY